MMRKVEFAWLLPVCMVLILVTVGAVLFISISWLQDTGPIDMGHDVVESSSSVAGPRNAPLDSSAANYQSIAAGDALFKGNCAQCHAVNDVVVGPALGGVTKRRPISWLIPWVKNSSKMVASGDEYAGKIFAQYQKQQMPSFQLSAAEIKDILTYIEAENQAGRANSPIEGVAIRD